jgi:hypothetical protein
MSYVIGGNSYRGLRPLLVVGFLYEINMKIISQIKKHGGELLTVLGVGIFSYNILNFSYTDNCPSGVLDFGFGFGDCEFEYLAYYYPESTLLLISIGAMLLVLGFINK